ncbi:PRC-barrel domain-containing protein [Leisingera aquaemixtae]|uniref:PRC-barrel domain-containing protein n=1 Tax=Leisingera aquaemixtae TaxID=1396826 RepID=UPI001C942046|nr:PRC-barrel domain-containing protein [Leisingera aquaemixtae]MBY6067459.1 PRC-barrel domain-containing protein [Leisingera aquaemixtae]
MKHLMLSTSLIVAAAVPAIAGSETEGEGSAEAGVQLESLAADASAGAGTMGEAKAESTPLQPATEAADQPAETGKSPLSAGTASGGGLTAILPDADAPAMEPLDMNEVTAEALTGAPAYDAKDDHIGELSQIIVNTNGGVEAVIIDVGGFLGIGEKPAELTMGDIQIMQVDGDLRVVTHLTREQLEALPDYLHN